MARLPTDAEWSKLHGWFPNLSRSTVWVLGNATPVYNCLAWALGYTDRWVWPWGSNEPLLSVFNSWIAGHGYVVGTPAAAASYGPLGYVGHISRFWVDRPSSKLGAYLLITHTWAGISGGTYGGIRQYYRRTAAVEADSVIALDDSEMPSQPRALAPLTKAEADRLAKLSAKVSAADRKAFADAWAAWLASLDDPRVMLDSTFGQPRRNLEFARLVTAARAAVPLLVEKLLDPREPRAIVVAEYVLPPELIVTFDPDDPAVLEGEQFRARLVASNVLSDD